LKGERYSGVKAGRKGVLFSRLDFHTNDAYFVRRVACRNELKQTVRLSDVGRSAIQSQNAKCVSVSHKNKSTLNESTVDKKEGTLMKKTQSTNANGRKQFTKMVNPLKSKSFFWLTAISLVFGS
jgi:hypothetical protein